MRRQNKQTDRYTAIKQIGKGSFGQVYKGIDKINKNQVALKFIEKRGKSLKDIQSLKQQNKLLKNIKHQNIINFIDFLQNQKEIIIVTDYAGSDLARVLQLKKKFSLDKVKAYCKQMLNAMLYLNQNRIIHRDLKPQNILIQDDHIKICDFGFAKKLSASTNFLKSIKGTPLYLAPQIVLEKSYTQKVDIWSFGCIIYQLFSGYPPFYANDYRRLAPKILHQVVKYPNDMPTQLRSLISCMLDKHDKTRYNWTQVKNHPFFRQPEPLSQIVQNLPKLDLQEKLQKKRSQKQKNQIREDVFYEQSRVLQKLDDKIQLQDFINIQKQIKVNSKQLRQDPCFEYKLNFVFRQKCRDYNSVSNQIIQKVLNILTDLAKQKTNFQCNDDVLKKQNLIIGILSVARLQQDFKMLQKQLKTLCYLIKKAFDGIQINSTINQEITEFITIILQKDNLPIQCLTNGLFIIGSLANQAILTFNRSEQYFRRIHEDKILTKICSFYKKKQEYGTVLLCIQQFIHPSTTKIPEDCQDRVVQILTKMKMQVAQALLNTDFISQISPLQVYKQNNGHYLKYYITVLLQCLQTSSQMRKKYAKYSYWNSLLYHKVTKTFAFVFNYLITQKEGLENKITKQQFKQFTKCSQDNKLINVYLIHSGYKNIKASKMPFQKNRAVLVSTVLEHLYEMLIIKRQQKTKFLTEVYGQLGKISKHFDQILINIFTDIVQTLSQYSNKQHKLQIVKNTQKIFQFLINNANKFQPTIYSLKNLMKVYVKENQNIITSKKNANEMELFFYNSLEECLRKQEFTELDDKQEAEFVSITADCLNFMNEFPQKPNQEHIMNVSLLTYRSNFYKRFFSPNLSQSDMISQLKCIIRIASKSTQMPQFKQNLYNFLGRQVIMRCTTYFQTINANLLVEICGLFSILSRDTTQFHLQLKQSKVVQFFQFWLTGQDKSELLKDKVLYLIGNMAKKSDYFFNDFNKYGVARAISKCIQKFPQNVSILKNTIYAVGNISFYNDRFSKQFQSLIPYFANALKTQSNLKNNLISTISNLLRFSDVYLKSLQKTGLISQIVQIFCTCQASDHILIGLCVSVIKKLLPHKQSLSDDKLVQIYNRRDIVKAEQAEVMNKIKKTLTSKKLLN